MAGIAAVKEWIKPAVIVFVLATVGINMLALGYIAMRAQREADESLEECHQLDEIFRMIKELKERP